MTAFKKGETYDRGLLFLIFFLTFIGFYDVLLVSVNIGLESITETISMPIRLGIVALCSLLFLKNLNHPRFFSESLIYMIFGVLYFLRILYDFSLNRYLYIEYPQLILYFLSFSVIPFVTISTTRLNYRSYNSIFKGLFLSSLIFSILSTVLYGKYLGTVARLASGYVEDNVLSPLILSYCSALGIGVIISYTMYNTVTKSQKIIMYSVVALNLVPFYLGASRGSIFAVFVPFLLMMLSKSSPKFILKSIIIGSVAVLVLYYIDLSIGSGFFDRLIGTADAVENSTGSGARIGIWNQSFEQFLDYPLFGDMLQTRNVDKYPHNIILEVLQSVGVLGAIPLLILFVRAFSICSIIFKQYPAIAWVPVIFIQAFVQHMFSGALYTASWLWTSMALLFAIKYHLKHEGYDVKC